MSPATSSDPTIITKAATATGTSNSNEGRSSGESTETLINVDDEALLGPKGAWLPDGYSQICVWLFGLLDYGSATLHYKN